MHSRPHTHTLSVTHIHSLNPIPSILYHPRDAPHILHDSKNKKTHNLEKQKTTQTYAPTHHHALPHTHTCARSLSLSSARARSLSASLSLTWHTQPLFQFLATKHSGMAVLTKLHASSVRPVQGVCVCVCVFVSVCVCVCV